MFHNGVMDDRLESRDLCLYFGFGYNKATKLYFDSAKFPPPPDDVKQLPAHCPAFENLRVAIRNAAQSCGSRIISNGSSKGQRKFCCSENCRMAQEDRPRKRQRTKTLPPGECCNFNFRVDWDQRGFFLNPRAGNTTHSFHAPVDPASNPPISAKQKKTQVSAKQGLVSLVRVMNGLLELPSTSNDVHDIQQEAKKHLSKCLKFINCRDDMVMKDLPLVEIQNGRLTFKEDDVNVLEIGLV